MNSLYERAKNRAIRRILNTREDMRSDRVSTPTLLHCDITESAGTSRS
jgi:hypothetical protein